MCCLLGLCIFIVQIWIVIVCIEVGVLVACNGVLVCFAFGQAALLIECIEVLLSDASFVSVYIYVLCQLRRGVHLCRSWVCVALAGLACVVT